jgi:hypothetical protein
MKRICVPITVSLSLNLYIGGHLFLVPLDLLLASTKAMNTSICDRNP